MISFWRNNDQLFTQPAVIHRLCGTWLQTVWSYSSIGQPTASWATCRCDTGANPVAAAFVHAIRRLSCRRIRSPYATATCVKLRVAGRGGRWVVRWSQCRWRARTYYTRTAPLKSAALCATTPHSSARTQTNSWLTVSTEILRKTFYQWMLTWLIWLVHERNNKFFYFVAFVKYVINLSFQCHFIAIQKFEIVLRVHNKYVHCI